MWCGKFGGQIETRNFPHHIYAPSPPRIYYRFPVSSAVVPRSESPDQTGRRRHAFLVRRGAGPDGRLPGGPNRRTRPAQGRSLRAAFRGRSGMAAAVPPVPGLRDARARQDPADERPATQGACDTRPRRRQSRWVRKAAGGRGHACRSRALAAVTHVDHPLHAWRSRGYRRWSRMHTGCSTAQSAPA